MSDTSDLRITEFYVVPPIAPEWEGSAWVEPLKAYCATQFPGLKVNVLETLPSFQMEDRVAVIPMASAPHPTKSDCGIMLPITDETHATMAEIRRTVEAFDPANCARVLN